MGNIAETDRSEAAAERGSENVGTGIVVEASTKVLSGIASEDTGGRINVDRGQFDPGWSVDRYLARISMVDDRGLAVAQDAVRLDAGVRACQIKTIRQCRDDIELRETRLAHGSLVRIGFSVMSLN